VHVLVLTIEWFYYVHGTNTTIMSCTFISWSTLVYPLLSVLRVDKFKQLFQNSSTSCFL